jgi:hypothetical protein
MMARGSTLPPARCIASLAQPLEGTLSLANGARAAYLA